MADEVNRLETLGNAIRALTGAQIKEVEPYYRASTMSQIAGLALSVIGMAGMAKGKPGGTEAAGVGAATTPSRELSAQGLLQQQPSPVQQGGRIAGSSMPTGEIQWSDFAAQR